MEVKQLQLPEALNQKLTNKPPPFPRILTSIFDLPLIFSTDQGFGGSRVSSIQIRVLWKLCQVWRHSHIFQGAGCLFWKGIVLRVLHVMTICRSRCRCLVPQRCADDGVLSSNCYQHLPNQIKHESWWKYCHTCNPHGTSSSSSSSFTWWMTTILRLHEIFISHSSFLEYRGAASRTISMWADSATQLKSCTMDFGGFNWKVKVLQRDDSCIVLEMNGHEIFKFFALRNIFFILHTKIHRLLTFFRNLLCRGRHFFGAPDLPLTATTAGTLRWVTSEAC